MKDLLHEDYAFVFDTLIRADLDPELEDEYWDNESKEEAIEDLRKYVAASKNKREEDVSIRIQSSGADSGVVAAR